MPCFQAVGFICSKLLKYQPADQDGLRVVSFKTQHCIRATEHAVDGKNQIPFPAQELADDQNLRDLKELGDVFHYVWAFKELNARADVECDQRVSCANALVLCDVAGAQGSQCDPVLLDLSGKIWSSPFTLHESLSLTAPHAALAWQVRSRTPVRWTGPLLCVRRWECFTCLRCQASHSDPVGFHFSGAKHSCEWPSPILSTAMFTLAATKGKLTVALLLHSEGVVFTLSLGFIIKFLAYSILWSSLE